MKRVLVVVAILSLCAVSSGCYRTVYRGGGLPFQASLNLPDPSTEQVVSHFEESKWNHFFLFALVPTSEPDLGKLMGRAVPAGGEVRNLKIRHEVTFVNGLVWVLVGGLYNPMTTTVSGDVVMAR